MPEDPFVALDFLCVVLALERFTSHSRESHYADHVAFVVLRKATNRPQSQVGNVVVDAQPTKVAATEQAGSAVPSAL